MIKFVATFTISLLLTAFNKCSAQIPSSLIVNEKGIAIDAYPIYHDLKAKDSSYNYLDSLDFSVLTYLSDGLKVKAYVVQPKLKGKYPCIIFNRGGNKEFGAWNPVGAIRFLSEIAKEGYVVIASQYRGNGGGEGAEEFGGADVNDVIILPTVLSELEKADTSKIGMYGWSRGGMMTYMAIAKMKSIKAVVVGGGVTDHLELLKDRPKMESVYEALVPNYTTRNREELIKRSVVYWADQLPKKTPILLLHGGADWRVKPSQSLKLALKLEEFQIPYRLIIYEGDDHGIRNHQAEVNHEAMTWLERYVKNGEAFTKNASPNRK